jgi:hypothetical protein
MATEFTKNGHRLESDSANPLVFKCRSAAVYQQTKGVHQKSDEHLLAAILIYAPCTVGQMIATLRAWLSVYADTELLEQVSGVVQKVIDDLSSAPRPSTSTPPQTGQGQVPGLN